MTQFSSEIIISVDFFNPTLTKGHLLFMFQCQSGYTLRKIKDTCYLLPYGQQIAEQRKGMVLNETGTLLWNLLQHNEGMEFDDLVSAIARIYQRNSCRGSPSNLQFHYNLFRNCRTQAADL